MGQNFMLYVNIAIAVAISGLFTYYISSFLAKMNKWLAFLIPGIILIIAIFILTVALTIDQGEGLGALGIIVLFLFAMIIFVATFITSLVVFFRLKKDK